MPVHFEGLLPTGYQLKIYKQIELLVPWIRLKTMDVSRICCWGDAIVRIFTLNARLWVTSIDMIAIDGRLPDCSHNSLLFLFSIEKGGCY